MCPRGQGRPRGLHLCNLRTEFNLVRYQTTLFVEFWFRKNRTTYDETRLYYVYSIHKTSTKRLCSGRTLWLCLSSLINCYYFNALL